MSRRQPPYWPLKFLRLYCREDYLEEIEGDILEHYEIRQIENHRYPNVLMILNVLAFIKWSNLKKPSFIKHILLKNHTMMFKNHIHMAMRAIAKNPYLSGVNILGLALAIGCSITSYLFIDMQLHMDDFHHKSDHIYNVLSLNDKEEQTYLSGQVPFSMATNLQNEFSYVKNTARIQKEQATVKSGNNVYFESVYFADAGLLEIFDFDILIGKASTLLTEDEIIISQPIAEKYFPNSNPIGKILEVKLNNKIKYFEIGAVLDKYPLNAAVKFDIIIPMNSYPTIYVNDQKQNVTSTFVELSDKSKLSDLIRVSNNYIPEDSENSILAYRFMPLSQLALNGYKIKGAIAGAGHPVMRLGLGILALLILLLASVNFLNISLVSSVKRLKEIGIRKAMGGSRLTITAQIFIENLLISIFALVLGTVLCYQFFMPSFSRLVGFTIPFEFSSLTAGIGFYSGLLLIIAITACLYPSLYTSRFNAIHIMSKNVNLGKKSFFTKSLLAVQFTISFVLLVACVLFTQNSIHFNNKSWGYAPEGIYAIHATDTTNYALLKNELTQVTGISAISGSDHHIGMNSTNAKVNYNSRSLDCKLIYSELSYPSMMNLDLADGSFPEMNQVIVNQTARMQLGEDISVGDPIAIEGKTYEIAGILKDFSFQSINQSIEPLIIVPREKDNYNYLIFKTDAAQNELQIIEQVNEAWYELNEYSPIRLTHQEDIYDSFYQSNLSNAKITIFVSLISILLVCMGTYGVVAFNIQGKLKEFSIRKTLGANELSILKIISKGFGFILFGSFLVSLPVGIKIIQNVVNKAYPDAQPFSMITALSVLGIMILFVSLTLGFKIRQAMNVNAIENLRNE